MKTAFIKFLPIAAAVLLATSCSKDDNDNAPATQSGSDGVETVTANTIPFSIRVNTGHSLKKMAYENGTEVGSYQPKFEQSDKGKLTMIIKDGDNVIGNLTLDDAKTATFSGNLTQQPSSNATLTAEISVSGSKNSSDVSLADLLATCAHTFSGTFTYGAAEVDLTDQTSYLAITLPSDENTVNVNGNECALKDGKVWVAFNSSEKVHSARLSLFNKQADPGTIYTVTRGASTFNGNAEFSVSPSKKVKFSPGNLLYQASSQKWEFAARQWDCVGEADGNTTTENRDQNVAYIDLFGWGTWLQDGNPTDVSTNTIKYQWNDTKTAVIGSEWTTLSKDEWVYLLGDLSDDNTLCRDNAKSLRDTKEVNGVFGLVILPDGATADIAKDSWETLESAGAVFLPAAGCRFYTSSYSVGDQGLYWSSSDKDENLAFFLELNSGNVDPGNNISRMIGLSVRLVRAL